MALCTYAVTSARLMPPAAAALASNTNGLQSQEHAPNQRTRAGAWPHLQVGGAPGDEAVDGPAGEAEAQLCWRADRRPTRRRSRCRCAARASSVLRSHQIALSRSSQCMASQAPAIAQGPPGESGEECKTEAMPPIISTMPDDEIHGYRQRRSRFMPRSKSRATVRSLVRAGSSRSRTRRSHAGLGKPVVEPGGCAVSEIWPHCLMNRAEHLQHYEVAPANACGPAPESPCSRCRPGRPSR